MRARPRPFKTEWHRSYTRPAWWRSVEDDARERTRREDRHIPDLELFFGRMTTESEYLRSVKQMNDMLKRAYAASALASLNQPHPLFARIAKA